MNGRLGVADEAELGDSFALEHSDGCVRAQNDALAWQLWEANPFAEVRGEMLPSAKGFASHNAVRVQSAGSQRANQFPLAASCRLPGGYDARDRCGG